MPLLPCPFCNRSISVTISQAGSEVTCPECQRAVEVPKLGELKRLAASAEQPESPQLSSQWANGPADSSAESNSGRRIAFAGLLAIAGVALVAGAFCFVRYLAIEIPATSEAHIAEIEQIYKQVPASQLVREWQQMEKYGLDVPSPYGYKKLEIEKNRWQRNTLISAGVIGIALVAAVGLMLTSPKRRPTPSEKG